MSTATTEKAAAAPETVVAIDPRQVQIGANVRLDANVDKEFVANVREEGVIVPVVGYFDGDGHYVVVDGQRRTLAAIEAKQATIPAFATRRREDADRIVAQMSANHHRVAITAAERAKGFEQLAGFGMSAAQIVKKTGYKRPEVDAGLKVAGSDLASKATERWGFLTLEQAAALARFDQDADALKALTVAAERGSGFDHELQRQRDKREEREALKAFAEQLTADGVTVIERPPHDHKTILRLNQLDDAEGNRITPETHADCPGHAAYVTREWRWIETDDDDEDATDEQEQVTVATYVCTDAKAHGHVDRWAGGYGGSTKKKAADMSEAEREAARAERRDVIESNKAWKSAETVRAAFVVKFLTRKTAPKGSAAFVVATIAEEGHWLSDHRTPTKADELLNGGKARMRADRAKAAENVTEGRALMLAVGQCCAAYEAQMGTHTWRNVTPGPARYLAFPGSQRLRAGRRREACRRTRQARAQAASEEGPQGNHSPTGDQGTRGQHRCQQRRAPRRLTSPTPLAGGVRCPCTPPAPRKDFTMTSASQSVTESRDEVCAFLKVRFSGQRRFVFVTPSYGTTHLKFHAAMIPTRARAIAAAEAQLKHASEHGIEAVAVMQGGRRVFHRLATTAKEATR